MSNEPELQIYRLLEITGESSITEIWLGDDEGHLVLREIGVLRSSLKPGRYTVEFALGGACYPVVLSEDLQLSQAEIESGAPIERPVPNV